MTNDFWLARWKEGRIGFHQNNVDPQLIKYWPTLPKNSHVLVPLCGKSNDLIWLAEQSYRVTGIELSPLAVIQFLGDNDLSYDTTQTESLKIHTVKELPIRIIEGDYFTFQEKHFDACYDRAAMVAVSDEQRQEYVNHTLKRLTPNAFIMVVSLYYDGDKKGPPFSIKEEDVSRLWGNNIHKVAMIDLVQTDEKYKAQGHTFFEESVWRIQGEL